MRAVFGWLFAALFSVSSVGFAIPTDTHGAVVLAQELWPIRDRAKNAQRVIEVLEQAKQASPEDYAIRWQLARFIRWHAQTLDKPARHAAAQRCWTEAREAIRLQSERVEGHYWAAACIGTYADTVPVTKALFEGLPDKFEHAIHEAIRIDAQHDNGGPLRALSRYYMTLPWPYKNLDKARVWIDKALAVDPHSPANLFFQADLERRTGDGKALQHAIEQLFALNETIADGPRIRRYQARAQSLLHGGEVR